MPQRQLEGHPYGVALLARDTKENRALWGDDFPFGYTDVDPNVCDGDRCPVYRYRADATPEGALETPIHILIAAYRDRLCSRTLRNIFDRAKNPARVFVRVIDQTFPGSQLEDDEGCWEGYCRKYNSNCNEFKEQVQIVHVDSSKSKGPTDARSKLSAMVHWDYVHRNDGMDSRSSPTGLDFHPVHATDFCMQIDSHMDFADNFDTGLIEMFHRAENDYAVLSTYVASMEQNNQDVRVVPNLCMVVFTSSIRNWATKECKFLTKPKLTNAMWGAGLSFHRCHAELNVPVDPYLDGVFDGEEGSRGLRLFTHGYDVYTPDRVLVTHDYNGHQGNPVVHTWRARGDHFVQKGWKWFQDIEKWRPRLSVFGTPRVNLLLGIGHDESNVSQRTADEIRLIRTSRFGLGSKRTLKQASEFSGINLSEKRMEENRCGNMKWVPFEESDDYGLSEYLARPYAGEVVAESTEQTRKLSSDTAAANAGASPSAQQQQQQSDVNVVASPFDSTNAGHLAVDGRLTSDASGWIVPAFFVVAALAVVARIFGKSDTRLYKKERHIN